MRVGAVVDEVDELGRVEGSFVEKLSPLGLLRIGGDGSLRVKLCFGPLARCLGTIQGLWRGPSGGGRCGSPRCSGLISCFRLPSKLRVIVSP